MKNVSNKKAIGSKFVLAALAAAMVMVGAAGNAAAAKAKSKIQNAYDKGEAANLKEALPAGKCKSDFVQSWTSKTVGIIHHNGAQWKYTCTDGVKGTGTCTKLK